MPRFLVFKLVAAAILAGIGAAAHANAALMEPRPAMESAAGLPRWQWAALSPAERQQMRSQIRDHWRNMPPEERRRRREEAHERWQQMTPEERRQIRDTIRERRGGDAPASPEPDPGRH